MKWLQIGLLAVLTALLIGLVYPILLAWAITSLFASSISNVDDLMPSYLMVQCVLSPLLAASCAAVITLVRWRRDEPSLPPVAGTAVKDATLIAAFTAIASLAFVMLPLIVWYF